VAQLGSGGSGCGWPLRWRRRRLGQGVVDWTDRDRHAQAIELLKVHDRAAGSPSCAHKIRRQPAAPAAAKRARLEAGPGSGAGGGTSRWWEWRVTVGRALELIPL